MGIFLNKLKKILISFSIVLFIFIIFFIFIFSNVFLIKLDRDIVVEVNEGLTLRKFIDILEEKGFSGNKFAFYFYARFLKPYYVLKKGKYNFKKGYNFQKILKITSIGSSELKKVTIPPGLKLKELIEYLDKNQIITKNDFYKMSKDTQFLINWDLVYYANNLEGFIFPETYFYSVDLNSKEVLKIFINELFKNLRNLINIENYSLKELYDKLIIASLIEEEAFYDEEKPIIASVIYNRIKKGMRLELCPTVEYILDRHKKYLTNEDLLIKSPYNTYLYKGLPPTPICNPGYQSLKASFYPAQTDYLFYVSKGDGTHYFSKTYEEHMKYKRKSNYYQKSN